MVSRFDKNSGFDTIFCAYEVKLTIFWVGNSAIMHNVLFEKEINIALSFPMLYNLHIRVLW